MQYYFQALREFPRELARFAVLGIVMVSVLTVVCGVPLGLLVLAIDYLCALFQIPVEVVLLAVIIFGAFAWVIHERATQLRCASQRISDED